MARKSKPLTIKVTHRYVYDPEAVERGLQAWAMFLADHLRKQIVEESRKKLLEEQNLVEQLDSEQIKVEQ